MDTYPAILNKLFGTKIKVIAGYKDGTDGLHRHGARRARRPLRRAAHGDQVDAAATGSPSARFTVPILIAEKRSAEFPDTPTVMEFVKDEPTRQQLDLVMVVADASTGR